MLRELRIRDVAIIEDLAIEFSSGLNVLSGETGTGKSIILGALGLVLGARASADMVRTSAESAEVQARVDRDEAVDAVLAELDLSPGDEDDGLLLRRIVMSTGRSRAYVGESAVTVGVLRRLATVLVDYASQHEHQVLLDEAQHLGILDRFGAHAQLREHVESHIESLRALLDERSRLARLDSEQRAREDYLRFQLDELEALSPRSGEQEELLARRLRLRNAEELTQHAQSVEELLSSGPTPASEAIGRALRRLGELSGIDSSMAPTVEGLESALILVEEASRDVADYARQVRSDPAELQEVEDRLAALSDLARKHHCDVDELEGLLGRLRTDLAEFEGLVERLDDLEPRIAQARSAALASTSKLSEARSLATRKLGQVVESELSSLSMKGARFVPELRPVEEGVETLALGEGGGGPHSLSTGTERVRFLLCANPGEDLKPLARTASGGELSRILLALRRALAGSAPVQTCVFDEIDSGLGGETSDLVAQKLSEIASEHQVLCITHLAQIAARADRHFRVDKGLLAGRTTTSVVALDRAESVGELVRMMAGAESTDSAREFARELLDRAGAERSDRMRRPPVDSAME